MPGTDKPKKAAKTTAPKKTATPKREPVSKVAKAIPSPVRPVDSGPKSRGGYSMGVTNQKFEIDLPSGATCLAIRPGPQGLMKVGLLDSMDQLTGYVQTEHIDGNDPRKQLKAAVEKNAQSPEQLREGLELVDKCIAHIVKEPKLYLDEFEEDGKTLKPRDPEKLYADEVDLIDKMFVFQWAMGGTADLASFREEYAELMGGISAE